MLRNTFRFSFSNINWSPQIGCVHKMSKISANFASRREQFSAFLNWLRNAADNCTSLMARRNWNCHGKVRLSATRSQNSSKTFSKNNILMKLRWAFKFYIRPIQTAAGGLATCKQCGTSSRGLGSAIRDRARELDSWGSGSRLRLAACGLGSRLAIRARLRARLGHSAWARGTGSGTRTGQSAPARSSVSVLVSGSVSGS